MEATMLIAMNRFKVNPGQESTFEEMWRGRETYLNEVPGFLAFSLLRDSSTNGGVTEYISHSTWQTRQDFEAWTQSDAFNRGHSQGSVAGVLAGPPQVSLYEVVLHQEKEPAESR
jgi:heme-degrading monooxygenase HmoA